MRHKLLLELISNLIKEVSQETDTDQYFLSRYLCELNEAGEPHLDLYPLITFL